MFGDKVERAIQEEGKGLSMGTETGMPKSQVGKGKWPGWYKHSVLEGEEQG